MMFLFMHPQFTVWIAMPCVFLSSVSRPVWIMDERRQRKSHGYVTDKIFLIEDVDMLWVMKH